MTKGSGPQLPEAEIRRLLSSLQIDHSEVKPGKDLDLLLKRAIKKVENLSEAVAGGGQKKLDPASLPRSLDANHAALIGSSAVAQANFLPSCCSSPKDQAAVRAFNTSYTFNEIIQELREQAGDCSLQVSWETVFFTASAAMNPHAEQRCGSPSKLLRH